MHETSDWRIPDLLSFSIGVELPFLVVAPLMNGFMDISPSSANLLIPYKMVHGYWFLLHPWSIILIT